MQRVSYINGGYAFKSTKYQEEGIRVIRISDFDESGLKYKNIVRYPYSEELNSYQLEENNILLAMTGGTVGKSYLVERIDEPMYVNQRVATIKILQHIDVKYINATILSDLVQKIIIHSKNSTNDNISMDTICNFLIPLPPLSEQKRIVKKIEELEPFIEEYGKAETELTALNNNFPEQIKKSILQYAIQGKLVEQDPNDEPASELLKKIKAEKAELVKKGKIKKDKQESYIFKGDDNRHYEQIGSETKDITDEIPFEIPNNWEWVRFANVSLYSTDYVANGSFASLRENVKIYKEKNFALLVKTQDFSNNFSRDLTYIDERSYNFLEKSKLYGGELMMSNIGASIGKVFIIPNLNMPMSIAPNSIIIKFSDENITQFVNYLISSPFGQDILKVFTAGTAMPKFSKTQLRGCLISIPPYGEQIRIINKIKKLFDLIESL
ncbi:MAG: restriction endonuclease subunit S [Azospirillum sp.]|nr:restriction endonuclease subunit S [Azospirillum sp.]